MDKEKAKRIQSYFNWARFVILVMFVGLLFWAFSK